MEWHLLQEKGLKKSKGKDKEIQKEVTISLHY